MQSALCAFAFALAALLVSQGAALAQASAGKPGASRAGEAELRERAIARCKANRGVDCETPAGLNEWIMQERPMTGEQRRAAVARQHRERCRANKGGPGC